MSGTTPEKKLYINTKLLQKCAINEDVYTHNAGAQLIQKSYVPVWPFSLQKDTVTPGRRRDALVTLSYHVAFRALTSQLSFA